MRTLYFDCASGISGDMIISSLVSLTGARHKYLDRLKEIALEGYHAEIKDVVKSSIKALGFKVILDEEQHQHRNLNDIFSIIRESRLNNDEKKLSREIFAKLGQAEAKVHGQPINEVHFHEVGAVDSIIDIVGTSILINMIKPDRIIFSPLPVGGGSVDTAHGRLPVPAPATSELLKGVPVYDNGIHTELVTPTGAAIVSALSDGFGGMPEMTINEVGYGSGEKDLSVPNLLRVFLGEAEGCEKDRVYLLETNIDDMNPQAMGHIMDRLFKEGALDVFLQPVIMKKSRPADVLSVICKTTDLIKMQDIIFKETTSFGIRRQIMDRSKLDREIISTETDYGTVRIKLGYLGGRLIKAMPEYEDVKKAAELTSLPFNTIYNDILCKCKDMLK